MPSKIFSLIYFSNEDTPTYLFKKNTLGIIAATLFTVLFTVGLKIGKNYQKSAEMRVKTLSYC